MRCLLEVQAAGRACMYIDNSSHVVWSADEASLSGAALKRLQGMRDAKVGQVGMLILVQQNVGWLEVKMPDILGVKLTQPLNNLHCHAQHLCKVQRPCTAPFLLVMP